MSKFLSNIRFKNFNEEHANTLVSTMLKYQEHFNICDFLQSDNDLGQSEDAILDEYPTIDAFVHECGNEACIAGWAALLMRDERLKAASETVTSISSRELALYIGIDSSSASAVASSQWVWADVFGGVGTEFDPDNESWVLWSELTAQHGADMINAIIGEYRRRL